MGLRRFLANKGLLTRKKNLKPSLNDLDSKLEKYLDFRDGFFIEAGANDGYTQSNTYYLEKQKNWRGVLIEGIPDLYQKCLKERTQSKVYNCALVAPDFPEETIQMQYANLMSIVSDAWDSESMRDTHIKNGLNCQNIDSSYSVSVPARTLSSVLDTIQNLPEIDFFSLDVEGYELSVLKGLDLSRHRPKMILVEANHFDEVNSYLLANNYYLAEKMSVHDCFYIDNLKRKQLGF